MSNVELEQKFEAFRADFESLRREICKAFVGQADVVEGVLTALVAGGHVLLEGLPGMGKTALAHILADVLDVSFQRIQCTPDLMSADIIGTYVIMETPEGRRTFEFQRGPLFSNIVLADQINRAMPKTQSALLEAMDDTTVTVSTETFQLPLPYFVIATQNPLELEGTFPLPEAQLDRFLFKLAMHRPTPEEMETILDRTTEAEAVITQPVVDGPRVLEMGELIRHVKISTDLRRKAIRLVTSTDPADSAAPEPVRRYVAHGAGPRGAQALVLAAKTRALVAGRTEVAPADVRGASAMALRHRIALNFDGQAEGISPDSLLDQIVSQTAGLAG
ncbi:MAG: MoxR family ATPase [Planctomycetaceae bacterium]|nr:MoxR family ATPase [Planctomycetaceae bacterium]